MLVVTRKTSEQILIPSLDLTITVLKTDQQRVQLGITAPETLQVVRADARLRSPRTSLPRDPESAGS